MKSVMHYFFMFIEMISWMVAIIEPAALSEGVDLTSVILIELAAIAGGLACNRWAWKGWKERRR